MFLYDPNFLALQQRHRELIREAQRERLAQVARAWRPGNERPRRSLMPWIGARLAWLGRALHGDRARSPECCAQAALHPCACSFMP